MLAATQSQLVTAGSNAISTISQAPLDVGENLTWRLISDEDGTILIPESSDGIVTIDDGHDAGLCRYDRPFTAPASSGRYLTIWRYYDQELAQSVIVEPSPDTAFATSEDVSTRLGRALTSQESTQVPLLLNMAAVVLTDAAGYDDGWAASLSPVPQMLRLMSIELVCRAMPNPNQYTSIRQQVGSYSIAVTSAVSNMALSDAEVLAVRRAVHGRTTDSVHIDSSFIPAQDEYWLRQQAARFADRNTGAATL